MEGPVVREVQDVLKVRQRIETLQIGGVSGGNQASNIAGPRAPSAPLAMDADSATPAADNRE